MGLSNISTVTKRGSVRVTTIPQIHNIMASDKHAFAVRPQTPNQRFRNQPSLERLLSFTLLSSPPSPEEVHEASLLYHLILDAPTQSFHPEAK